MPPPDAHPPITSSPNAWRRLHAALMPDYNRQATTFWWLMALLGLAACAQSLASLASLPASALLQVVGGITLAMLMGLFPLKIPRTNQSFSLGEVFIFLLLLAHGAAAGCVAAALEALVSSWRSSKRWTTRLGSTAIAASVMFACGHALQEISQRFTLLSIDHAAPLVLSSMAFGLVYIACSAVLMSTVARLKRNERTRLTDFVGVFGWVGGASAVAAAIAALLFITQRLAGFGVMLTTLPIVGLLLTTLHFFSRQQEAEQSARNAAERALKREAELTAELAKQHQAETAAQHLRELGTSERRFQSAFTHASIGMALVSTDGTIHLANPALHTLLGCTDNELTDHRIGNFMSVADARELASSMTLIAYGADSAQAVEMCCRRADGAEVWAHISCSVFADPKASGPSLIMQVQDTTARHRAESALEYRATHDSLTGLPNRACFHDALGLAIERADGGPGRSFAVLFLDFDRFKLINDSKGHTVGDEFLVRASNRLARCLRKGDMLARLGGDEFAILAANIEADTDAVELAERLLKELRAPLKLSAMEIIATASIGITFSSMGYSRPEDMLRDADIAMYRAKLDGKARYALFDVRLHAEVAGRVRLEEDLRKALAERALWVVYQPLYELSTGRLKGFEALSRWTHRELGVISPATFVPIAEESGLIIELTRNIVEDACRQLRTWQMDHPAFADLSMHVNVAAKDVADPDFVARVKDVLRATGLEPRHLVIELTENILMAQLSAALATLTALRGLGIGLSVDDFGTGYSSLSHLSVLPIDSLKIDMSFVRNLRADSNEAAVVRAIILLGTSLGKEVIAEGVETQEQFEILRELGCAVGQGYFLSRPLAPDAVDALLRSQSDTRGLRLAATAQTDERRWAQMTIH